MDDDVSVCREYTLVGKSGEIRPRVCREYTRVGKLYSAANSIQTCQTTAHSQLLAIILLTAGLSRGLLEVNKLSFSDISTILCTKVTYSSLVSNSYIYSRVKYYIMILPVA